MTRGRSPAHRTRRRSLPDSRGGGGRVGKLRTARGPNDAATQGRTGRLPPDDYARRYQLFVGRLREARRLTGVTQEDLAATLGKPQSFVSKGESGEGRVDFV